MFRVNIFNNKQRACAYNVQGNIECFTQEEQRTSTRPGISTFHNVSFEEDSQNPKRITIKVTT